MNRFWSILFFLVPLLGIGVCLCSAFAIYPFHGTWLPSDISETGKDIDRAFLVVMWIIGVTFLGTGLYLGLSLWLYSHTPHRKANYSHGNTKLEIIWSVIPGVILIGIFAYQNVYWEKQKITRPLTMQPDGTQTLKEPLVRVVAHKFGWQFWYAGIDGVTGTPDDFMLENELYLPMDQPIVLQLESIDVLHSFYLRHLRIKQDLVPGKQQYVWFKI
ncbi:MAG: cytochrome c oxidase subunit II, partial [Planctomycetota bacterium]|nr:cytochrome c oxidase subunit II [Planctomycetota bacterium]